ncbi:uncharacterized protein LOC123531853 [Mercenaria mercenaria]|uniref:uncharacterized protein LOC123531853 n=1 Tax=Mercenaria mercenaria TaxID=6596 RepID=UPI00234F88FE|nr:uncharacterized protein LOC123531853 [Mercenaria mercenaria]
MPGMSFSAQRAIMKNLSSRRLKTSDYWEYAVSMSWLESWDSCISHSLSLEHDNGFEDKGISKPVSMSRDDAENVYIPESQWQIYLTLFGIASDHELRRRPIYSLYSSLDSDRNLYGDHVIADKELDCLPILVADINDIATGNPIQKQISVFAWDSLAYIGKQAKTVLHIKRKVQVRLWLCILPKDQRREMIIEPIVHDKQTLLCKLMELVPIIKDLMKQRSNQINPKYIVKGKEEKSEKRKPLWEDFSELLQANSACIAIGIERIGLNIKTPDSEGMTNTENFDDDQLESIVMITSIQNEWEDVLTTFVEKYTEDMSGNIEALKEKLVNSAKSVVGEKMNEISEIREDFEKRFSMLEERENAVRAKENENNEKEADIADRLSKFKRGLEDFQKQKKKFADEVERMEAQNKIADSRVTLNIGGILYTTSVETLTKEEGSLLAMMFGGRHAVKREPDGTYFIDRDGVNFRYILNYLRDGTDSVEALPKEEKLIKELKIEAKYYGLTALEKLLQKIL